MVQLRGGHRHLQEAQASLSQPAVPEKPGWGIENPSQKEPKPSRSMGEGTGHGWTAGLVMH